ncbi:MAG: DUF4124 domain-containing protein [Dokdonella sp.]|jgi:hypothetical protein|uniref:DUF4124 domain-containing protein n=1 Tax=Dokdonella sp. TaxID=2291710 RepID=UPI001B4DA14D|nr:DUF4124 domain-containing protein [Dokdonella sp.]MBP6327332.1 DUF4124 domain-containing protein [Dokdonella sp.]HNV09197.1 DUF4124 domain-containing protein [Dokdonella sp.]HPW05004.1 DUF4124 domain-containing protein [Dokdonella sp.]
MKQPMPALLILLGLAVAPAAAQQVYSWTDANGTKHFSDMPPPPNTASAKRLNVRSGVTTTQAVEQPAADSEPAAGSGPAMAAAAGYSDADIKRNCAAAQKNLERYEAAKPAEDEEAEVQTRYQEGLSKVQSQIKLFCG